MMYDAIVQVSAIQLGFISCSPEGFLFEAY